MTARKTASTNEYRCPHCSLRFYEQPYPGEPEWLTERLRKMAIDQLERCIEGHKLNPGVSGEGDTVEYVSKEELLKLQVAVGEWLERFARAGEDLLAILEAAG